MDSVIDYDSMPADEELDVLVAKLVFGQTDFSHLPAAYEEGTTPDGEDGWDGFYCPRCKQSQGSYHHPCVQHYSTNIADAWKVIDRLKSISNGEFDDVWIGFLKALCLSSMTEYKNAITTLAEVMWHLSPLAICRAALKAVSQEV